MKDDKDKYKAQSSGLLKKDPRRDRLKLALRENLKRRKSQARGRGDVTIAASNGDDASPHDESGNKPSE